MPNFTAYVEQIQPNGDIILIKKIYGSQYEIENLPNGNILLKIRPPVEITVPQDLHDYNFTKSSIEYCNFPKRTYAGILKLVYSKINDGMTIILSSTNPRRITTIEKINHGYKWYPDLGISVQGANANNTIKEILTQCIANDIELSVKITLENGNKIHVFHHPN